MKATCTTKQFLLKRKIMRFLKNKDMEIALLRGIDNARSKRRKIIVDILEESAQIFFFRSLFSPRCLERSRLQMHI